MKVRFWFWVCRTLWHSADWVLTYPLCVPRSDPIRGAVSRFCNDEARYAARRALLTDMGLER